MVPLRRDMGFSQFIDFFILESSPAHHTDYS